MPAARLVSCGFYTLDACNISTLPLLTEADSFSQLAQVDLIYAQVPGKDLRFRRQLRRLWSIL